MKSHLKKKLTNSQDLYLKSFSIRYLHIMKGMKISCEIEFIKDLAPLDTRGTQMPSFVPKRKQVIKSYARYVVNNLH